jgi:hypothetical protein
MRSFVLLMLMLLSGGVKAQETTFTFSAVPSMPVPQQPFQIRIEVSPATCYVLPGDLDVTALGGNVIRYDLWLSESCGPIPDQERSYFVPALPAGVYTFRFAICSQPIPGNEPCTIHSEQTVFVGGAPQPSVIPTLSLFGLPLLLSLITLLAASALGRSRSSS